MKYNPSSYHRKAKITIALLKINAVRALKSSFIVHLQVLYFYFVWRCGGPMNVPSDWAVWVKALAGPLCCVFFYYCSLSLFIIIVFGQDTVPSQFLSPRMNLMLQWTSLLFNKGGGESTNTPTCFMLQKLI